MILAVEIGEYATHVERRRHGEAGRGELLVNTARIVRVERLDETVRRFSISQFARRISGADLGLQGRAGLDQIIDMLDGTPAPFGRFEDRQRIGRVRRGLNPAPLSVVDGVEEYVRLSLVVVAGDDLNLHCLKLVDTED